MIIVYPHLPIIQEKEKETKEFIDLLITKGYKVYDILTPRDNPYAYHNGLKKIWGNDDIIIMESDVVPTIKQLEDLIKCPHGTCTYDNPIMTDNDQYRSGIIKFVNGEQLTCTKEDEFADATGLAFVKISRELQLSTRKWFMQENFYYRYMDYEFWKMCGIKIHIHWEQTKHNHPYQRGLPKLEDRPEYDLKNNTFIGVIGNCLAYHNNDETDPEKLVLTCVHVLKLPMVCQVCMKAMTDEHAQQHKEMLING